MKKLFTTLAIAGMSFCAYAQNTGKISGAIQDGSSQKKMESLSISLLKSADSSVVKTAVSNKEGQFSFENLLPGTYLVLASSATHQPTYSGLLQISETASDKNVGTLTLMPITKKLDEVVVTSKKQFIERKIDKTIINPDALISNAGANAFEMLEKAPGVSVDKDGNISLKGKQGVIIMVDGKPTYLSGPDLVNFLTNLPASNLELVEIMTNPPAKYDAAGNSGIINFKTKRIKLKGFNGSLSSNQAVGEFFRTNNSLNLNYRKGKVNLFSTLNGNYRKQSQYLDIDREYLFIDKSVRAIFQQNSIERRTRQYYALKTGMDFYATKKTTLGLVFTGNMSPYSDPGMNTSYLRDAAFVLDSTVVANKTQEGEWTHHGVNVNMRHKFDSTGRELTADVDILKYGGDVNQMINSKNYLPNGNISFENTITGILPSDVHIFSIKTDYTQMIGKKIKMDAGIKTSFVETSNKANYFNTVNNITTVDKARTTNFDYKENINAAYVNMSAEVKKWGFQAGLRAENTSYEGIQYGNFLQPDSTFKNNYNSLFPTMYVSYKHNDKNQFGFNYGRRINRPNYENLNPFINFIDIYTYDVGNPFLRPMFSNNLELTHTYKNFLTTTVNYTHTNNLFGEAFDQEGEAIVVRPSNFGNVQVANFSVSAQVKPTKWWTAQLYSEVSYTDIDAQIKGNDIDLQMVTYSANANNQFQFNKGWSAELSGFFRSKGLENQINIRSLYQLNAGVQKQILKKKGSLRLAISDFTGPMKISGFIANIETANASFRQRRDSRVLTLGFNYRFGKPMKTEKRNTGGAADEQNRVGGGN